MLDYRLFSWFVFSETGNVSDYLLYKYFEKNLFKFEAGEEFGIDKNLGHSAEDNQVR